MIWRNPFPSLRMSFAFMLLSACALWAATSFENGGTWLFFFALGFFVMFIYAFFSSFGLQVSLKRDGFVYNEIAGMPLKVNWDEVTSIALDDDKLTIKMSDGAYQRNLARFRRSRTGRYKLDAMFGFSHRTIRIREGDILGDLKAAHQKLAAAMK